METLETYVVHVTKRCNCECLYCYEQDKTSTYTWEEIKKFIDDIVEYATNNTFSIEFLGGEPLLSFDLVKKSFEYMENLSDIIIPGYTITTNGTILNQDIIDFLKTNPKVNFAASMDGHKHANQLRVFKDTYKNTYDVVMQNLRTLNENDIQYGVHIVSHPYNIAYLSQSIDHLYNNGVRNIDVGTVEKTITIDEEYCNRFIKELDIISQKMVNGNYPGLSISLFNWVKPYEDVRTYIKDESGKTIGESYGRSGEDVTIKGCQNVIRCESKDSIADMIYYIRKTVYENHQKRLGMKGDQ